MPTIEPRENPPRPLVIVRAGRAGDERSKSPPPAEAERPCSSPVENPPLPGSVAKFDKPSSYDLEISSCRKYSQLWFLTELSVGSRPICCWADGVWLWICSAVCSWKTSGWSPAPSSANWAVSRWRRRNSGETWSDLGTCKIAIWHCPRRAFDRLLLKLNWSKPVCVVNRNVCFSGGKRSDSASIPNIKGAEHGVQFAPEASRISAAVGCKSS